MVVLMFIIFYNLTNHYINELYISVNYVFYSFYMWIYVECYRLNVTILNVEVIDTGLDATTVCLFTNNVTIVCYFNNKQLLYPPQYSLSTFVNKFFDKC